MNKFWKTVIILCIIYLATAMIISPSGCIGSARDAVFLCLDVIIPSLFPFFVCSNLLIALGVARLLSRYFSPFMYPLFGVSGSGALAVILGIISGYPIGASCAAQLYNSGNCTKTEAERLLAFCNNSGPLFILGAVGIGMFNNQFIGILLYVSHILSSLVVGMLFKNYGGETQPHSLPPSSPNNTSALYSAVGNAVSDAVTSVLKVCGFVILFAVFTTALPGYRGSEFMYAVLEITGGIKALLSFKGLNNFLLPVISFFLAFSGISVMLQVAGIIQPCGLSLKPYIFGKLLQGVLSFFITFILLIFFPIKVPAFMPDPNIVYSPVTSPKELLATAILCILFGIISVLIILLIGWLSEKFKKE